MVRLLYAGLALLLSYEVIAAISHKWLTISQLTWRFVGSHPQTSFLFGLAIGLLLGHLFL